MNSLLVIVAALGSGISPSETLPLFVLRYEVIHDELGLTPQQSAKVSAIVQAHLESSRGRLAFYKSLEGLPDAERERRISKYQKEQQEEADRSQRQIHENLTEPQKKRLRELAVQYRLLVFYRSELPEIEAQLKLSDAQKKKLSWIRGEFRRSTEKLDRFQDQDEISRFANAATQAITELLSDEQESRLRDMQGQRFDIVKALRAAREKERAK